MIRRPPRSTLDRSSAASDVYKRQAFAYALDGHDAVVEIEDLTIAVEFAADGGADDVVGIAAVSYTHLRAHETVLDIVCRLLLEKKKKKIANSRRHTHTTISRKYTLNTRIGVRNSQV